MSATVALASCIAADKPCARITILMQVGGKSCRPKGSVSALRLDGSVPGSRHRVGKVSGHSALNNLSAGAYVFSVFLRTSHPFASTVLPGGIATQEAPRRALCK